MALDGFLSHCYSINYFKIIYVCIFLLFFFFTAGSAALQADGLPACVSLGCPQFLPPFDSGQTPSRSTSRNKAVHPPQQVQISLLSFLNPLTFTGWAGVWWGPVFTNSRGSCQSPPHRWCFKPRRALCKAFPPHTRIMLLLWCMLTKVIYCLSLGPHICFAVH